jgi:hypothetical protein
MNAFLSIITKQRLTMKSSIIQISAFVLLSISALISQDIKIDVVINSNTDNEVYKLRDIVQTIISEQTGGCAEYNIMSKAEDGTADIILELWESKEYLDQGIFKETRKEENTDAAGKKTVTRRKVAGILVNDEIKLYARMTERESGSVIDLFVLLGALGHEYDVEEVSDSWTNDRVERRRIEENILFNNDDIVQEGRAANLLKLKEKLAKSMQLMVSDNLAMETKIVGIAKQKKDKVKKAKIEKCADVDFSKYGTFYFGIKEASEFEGERIYREVGSCYYDKDESIVGIKKGEKELLPLIKSGAELYIADADAIDQSNLSKFKTEETKDMAFVFFFDPTHTYSELDRLHIEFMYQASLLGFKDVRVIANDAVTESINEGMSKSIYSPAKSEKDKIELNIDNIKSTNTIYVGLSNPEKYKASLKLLFGEKPDEKARFMSSTIKYKDELIEIEENEDRQLIKKKTGYFFGSHEVKMAGVKNVVNNNELRILGVEEEKKGKVKKVIVNSNEPLSRKAKYNIYDKKITKKTKPVLELRIDEILNTYTAIAEVKKGDKKVLELLDSNKKLITEKKSSGGGILGALSGSSDGIKELKFYRTYYEQI